MKIEDTPHILLCIYTNEHTNFKFAVTEKCTGDPSIKFLPSLASTDFCEQALIENPIFFTNSLLFYMASFNYLSRFLFNFMQDFV